MDEGKAKIKRQFDAAVNVIQNLPRNGSFKPSHELLLKFYGYYKQATQGPCRSSRPGFFDMVGRAKWDAWNALGDMTAETAMEGYISELKQIIEVMPQTDEVSHLVKELDHFYELVNISTGESVSDGAFEVSSDTVQPKSDEPLDSRSTMVPSIETSTLSYDGTNEGNLARNHQRISPDILPAEETRARSDSYDSDRDSETYMDASDLIPQPTGQMNGGSINLTNGSIQPDVTNRKSCIPSNNENGHDAGVQPKSVRFNQHVETVSPATDDDNIMLTMRSAVHDMQQDLASLERRLALVERITMKQRKYDIENGGQPSWWPFPSIDMKLGLAVFIWPVFVAWFINYISRRRN